MIEQDRKPRFAIHNGLLVGIATFASLSGLRDHERDESPETFPDWLAQIRREYLHLTELYEQEREYGHRLAELMANVQREVGFSIPLNPIVLSAALPNLREAQLGEGAVIFYVDSAGNKGTRPLTLMPLETIIFTVHECTFRLKELISEKRRLMARRVRALERVNLELDKAHETLKYSEPDSEPELEKVEEASNGLGGVNIELEKVEEASNGLGGVNIELEKVEEASNGLAEVNLELDKTHEPLKYSEPSSEPELEKVEEASSGVADLSGSPEETPAPAAAPVGGFEYRGSFKDKRQTLEEKERGS